MTSQKYNNAKVNPPVYILHIGSQLYACTVFDHDNEVKNTAMAPAVFNQANLQLTNTVENMQGSRNSIPMYRNKY